MLLKRGELNERGVGGDEGAHHDRRRRCWRARARRCCRWPRKSPAATTSAGTAPATPQGLKGTDIPLVGRICAICDVFDALASKRSYKDPWPRDRILKEIVRKRGSHFDPRVVDAFLEVVGEFDDRGRRLRRRRRSRRAR